MIARLTSTEHEYIQALLDGFTTDAELSEHLSVDVDEVIKAMRAIYKKMGLTNRAQLILVGLEKHMQAHAKHTDMRARVFKVKGK